MPRHAIGYTQTLQPGDPKVCNKCLREFPYDPRHFKFKRVGERSYGVYCRQCYRTHYSAQGNQDAKFRRLKLEAIQVYGGQCQCCGEKEPAFLTFDHVAGDGREHRQRSYWARKGGGKFAYELMRTGYPPIVRVLCWNCHMVQFAGTGTCPHKTGTPKITI